jgi:L-alanine-DL-glutamate epimerase-like enolase superfamily enzyme
MYRIVLDAFPDALLEDPHELSRVEALIAPVRDRISLDAPIRTPADVGATRTINVKPSRIGGLRPLFAVYEWCEANGVAMYGGGMGELGVGRGQIELLAALFHPDAPNDVAPSAFNAPELVDGLPSSPLVLDEQGPGFR